MYNGATGIVVGFGFHTAIPEENFPTVNTFHALKNRELPIVFVITLAPTAIFFVNFDLSIGIFATVKQILFSLGVNM